jgi:hypothetical protein
MSVFIFVAYYRGKFARAHYLWEHHEHIKLEKRS